MTTYYLVNSFRKNSAQLWPGSLLDPLSNGDLRPMIAAGAVLVDSTLRGIPEAAALAQDIHRSGGDICEAVTIMLAATMDAKLGAVLATAEGFATDSIAGIPVASSLVRGVMSPEQAIRLDLASVATQRSKSISAVPIPSGETGAVLATMTIAEMGATKHYAGTIECTSTIWTDATSAQIVASAPVDILTDATGAITTIALTGALVSTDPTGIETAAIEIAVAAGAADNIVATGKQASGDTLPGIAEIRLVSLEMLIALTPT